MSFSWLCGLLLFIQSVNLPDSITVKSQGETIANIDRSTYESPIPGVPLIDLDKYNQLLIKLDNLTYLEPKNAYIDHAGQVREGEFGRRLYRKAFTDLFYSFFYHSTAAEIELPMLPIHPKVDRDLLIHIRTKQIGQYVTFFNQRNRARTHNIKLAAQAIDSYVIFPGETFSFNRIVGQRTKERGYMKAPVIVRGELSEDIGGGICQVSSTLFNATDRAGMKILARYSHSKKVPYVPPGRDAAVSWNGPDYRFKNIYSLPILIRAKVFGGQMVIQIYSSDEIDYEPRSVPEASKMLPEEIHIAEEAMD